MNWRHPGIIFFLAWILSYFVVSFCVWLYANYSSYHRLLEVTQPYVKKHQQDLKVKVFGELFNSAQRCKDSTVEQVRQDCYQKTTKQLAIIIKEEEFAWWPHDLFFVKQEGNKYFELGWSGEWKDISDYVNNGSLKKLPLSFFSVITHQCKYFYDHLSVYGDSCDVYVELPLSNNSNGYIGRLMSFGEEELDWFFVMIFPLLILPQILYYVPSAIVAKDSAGFFIFFQYFGFQLFLPLIIATIVFVLYRRKKKKTKK